MNRPMSDAEVMAAAILFRFGCTLREIAPVVRRQKTVVHRALKRRGWSRRPKLTNLKVQA